MRGIGIDMPDHNPTIEQGQGREPGDDYPGELYDAERAIFDRADVLRDWWHRQPVPFCHAAALAADALRGEVARRLARVGLQCAGCGGTIAGFTIGGRYCSRTCYHDYEGNP